MIYIPTEITEKACELHYLGIKKWVKVTLEFYIDLLDVYNDKLCVFVNGSLSDHYGSLDAVALNTMAKQIFNSNITSENIKGSNLKAFLEGNTSIYDIDVKLDLELLRELLGCLREKQKNLLNGHPDELEILKDGIRTRYDSLWPTKGDDDKKVLNEINPILFKIFNYDTFIKKGIPNDGGKYQAYDLTNLLDTKTCCYCNRLYANTILKPKDETTEREEIIRPTLDHYFDKAKYPFLALSFYNLIPSCTPCNSKLKHMKQFKLSKNLHPYIDKFSTYGQFSYYPQTTDAAYGVTDDIKVDVVSNKGKQLNFKTDEKLIESRKVFKYDVIYSEHSDVVQDLLLKALGTQRKYYTILKEAFDFDLSEEEFSRVAFGVFPEEENFHRRPLSVMINDLVEELGLK